MKRLIDAISLEKRIYDERKVFFIDDHKELLSKDDIYAIIKDEPPIDAVEVVRCQDCIHGRPFRFDGEEPEIMICINKNMFPMRTSPGFYCAHGERKTDAEVEE